jgi:hypothetical protein
LQFERCSCGRRMCVFLMLDCCVTCTTCLVFCLVGLSFRLVDLRLCSCATKTN